MIALYVALVLVMLGEVPVNPGWLDDAIVVLSATAAIVAVVQSRHPMVRLSVGETGIAVPFGRIRQVSWRDIESLEIVTRHPLSWHPRTWLCIRLTGRRSGQHLYVPLHVLKATPEEVRASIERFRPVAQITIETPEPARKGRHRQS